MTPAIHQILSSHSCNPFLSKKFETPTLSSLISLTFSSFGLYQSMTVEPRITLDEPSSSFDLNLIPLAAR